VPLKRRSTIILHSSTSLKTILNFIRSETFRHSLIDDDDDVDGGGGDGNTASGYVEVTVLILDILT
jgi:hypothetical protein